jgi:hypothetical protein
MTWTGGTLSGGGAFTTDAVGGVSLDTTSSNISINGGTLINDNNDGQDNNSSSLAGGNNAFFINGGGTFISKNIFTDTATDILNDGNGGTNTFENDYIFNTTGAVFIGSGITFNNTASGSVNVQSGFLWLDANDSGDSEGNFNVNAGAVLIFAGNYTLDAQNGYSLSGAGNVNFNVGTIALSGSVNLTGTASFNGASVTLSGPATTISSKIVLASGTLASSGDVTFNNPLIWTGGVLTASGTAAYGITLDPGASPATLAGGANLTNPVASYFLGNGTFEIDDSAALTNTGTFSAQGSGLIQGSNSGFFNNQGVFIRDFGTGTFVIGNGILFTNSGLVNVETGELDLQGGEGSPGTTGTFNVTSGATLVFDNTYTLSSSSVLKGAGTVDFNSGAISPVRRLISRPRIRPLQRPP